MLLAKPSNIGRDHISEEILNVTGAILFVCGVIQFF